MFWKPLAVTYLSRRSSNSFSPQVHYLECPNSDGQAWTVKHPGLVPLSYGLEWCECVLTCGSDFFSWWRTHITITSDNSTSLSDFFPQYCFSWSSSPFSKVGGTSPHYIKSFIAVNLWGFRNVLPSFKSTPSWSEKSTLSTACSCQELVCLRLLLPWF